jgi:L-Ala-D/L-Glu epimerase
MHSYLIVDDSDGLENSVYKAGERMIKWTLEDMNLPLKFSWKIARGEAAFKNNFLVRLKLDDLEGLGEVAFNQRYGEDKERLKEEFDTFSRDFPQDISSIEQIMDYTTKLELSQSLRFGIEAAFVDYLVKASGQGISELLGVPSVQSARTSFSLPIMGPEEIRDFLLTHNVARFDSLKVKVDAQSAKEILAEVFKHYTGRIRIDGNECWTKAEDVLEFLRSLPDINRIDFLEQPLSSDCHEEMVELKKLSPVELFADESLTDQNVTEYFSERFHGVNIKLMKSGSYLKAIHQLRQARRLGLKTMVGCMIETSLGISSAMAISYGADYLDLDGCLLIEKDPFNLLHEDSGKLFHTDLH